ncbi:MAG: amino acid synthesis family protein [Alphaproteobacteria bacterium]|nr:amino acid synthesis family protein [Alphaproteobacteria bacterium]
MKPIIRKLVSYAENVFIEGGRAGGPIKMGAIAAVIRSPWPGTEFVENLRPALLSVAPELGRQMVPLLIELCGGADKIEAYGKAAVVGLNGEIEHGSALIHTLRFGNLFREAVGGTSYLSFTNTRGPANAPITVPLMHKLDPGFRSHYMTLQFAIPDAPAPDEIVVVIAGATGGRMHPRIGNRYEDMEEMKAKA